ncbi:MAG: contact-dependent growth inhibition system immunity protein [Crocinitomicaceae bacterium]|nr:contact-dependent growth inhibition system immunity protein [Crocinitomicaceae bacterium]
MKDLKKIKNKSIAELEGYKWQGSIPTKESSFLERRFYELHDRKLQDLILTDVDLYIEQEYGLKYVIPIALDILDRDILIKVDYEGELLFNILSVKSDFWSDNPEMKMRLTEITKTNLNKLENMNTTDDIKNDILEALERFIDQ